VIAKFCFLGRITSSKSLLYNDNHLLIKKEKIIKKEIDIMVYPKKEKR
jgi:hypothetical protein